MAANFVDLPTVNARRITATDLNTAFQSVDVGRGVRAAKVGDTGWLEPIIGGTETIATAFGGSQNGGYGVIGASYLNSVSGGAGFGIGAFVLNDSGSTNKPCWTAYIEGRRLPGATGGVFNIESNVLNLGTVNTARPDGSNVGVTWAGYFTSGRHDVPGCTDTTAAIGIANNGTRFRTGIVLIQNSVADHVGQGTESFTRPISLDQPNRHGISWRNGANGNISSGIYSDVLNVSGGGYVAFVDLGVSLRDSSNIEVMRAGLQGVETMRLLTASGGLALVCGTYANDAAAAAAGVTLGGVYQLSTGALTRRTT